MKDQDEVPVLAIDHLNVGPYVRNTMMIDKCDTREEAH
jgi:DNA-directed RNA polymerase subunit beta